MEYEYYVIKCGKLYFGGFSRTGLKWFTEPDSASHYSTLDEINAVIERHPIVFREESFIEAIRYRCYPVQCLKSYDGFFE